jgi:glycosyltransferase involved in cell wall biosynthesis
MKFEPQLAIVNGRGPLAKQIPSGIKVHDLGVQRVRYALPKIIRLCRGLNPDAVISTLVHLNLSLLAGRSFLPKKTRLIIREANTPSIRLQYTRHPLLYSFLYKIFYPRADRIICNAHYMKEDLVEHFSLDPAKIQVIPNPVHIQEIRDKVRSAHNPYQPGKKHLVAVGRLNFQKGLDLLIKALKVALKENPDLHLTLIGEGGEEASLRQFAMELGIGGAVTFAGHRDDPFPFMAHADLLISSSRYEGLPNVVLESLGSGTPVLAFDCPGGTREIIREGENGWLVPAEDWKMMGRKIVELIEDRATLKRVRSGPLLPEVFLSENVIKKYEELLKESHS